MGNITLISGPVKSGKSNYAESIVKSYQDERVAYIATQANQFLDSEMESRIEKHQSDRPDSWVTIEEYKDLDQMIKESNDYESILMDCVTLWVNNLFFDEIGRYYVAKHQLAKLPKDFDVDAFINEFTKQDTDYMQEYLMGKANLLINAMKQSETKFVVVTNEVGWSITPPTKLGRIFADYYGIINRHFAKHADNVYMVELGIARQLKP
ncbi:bifunctional adenosylcobinamide kinase/adenosylcobinamide-phosphate guanylyltransferase [Aerococcaceae bacterium DSM 111021]|nr:bifunctional adenosylcobinamide kinase/adenosylcobinamide-phosphate guanylyltransferase [Aerococcaceae bacterium DSM 111021]